MVYLGIQFAILNLQREICCCIDELSVDAFNLLLGRSKAQHQEI